MTLEIDIVEISKYLGAVVAICGSIGYLGHLVTKPFRGLRKDIDKIVDNLDSLNKEVGALTGWARRQHNDIERSAAGRTLTFEVLLGILDILIENSQNGDKQKYEGLKVKIRDFELAAAHRIDSDEAAVRSEDRDILRKDGLL